MSDTCDHTSVGMVVMKGKTVLLNERRKPPFGFAPPAGHVDGDDTYEKAAIRELKEEVGLTTVRIKLLIEGRKDNPCRRKEGDWHYWKIYRVETKGSVKRSLDETKRAAFYSINTVQNLAAKTEKYLAGYISPSDWEKSPGLEPIWYDWIKKLKII